jgi:hypothetical protein
MNKTRTLIFITIIIGSIFCNIFLFYNSINAELLDIIDDSDSSNKETENIALNSDGWYYLPTYPNYAPCGMPDFDEEQQESWLREDGWPLFCGAAAVANVFWWFDSKHEDTNGYPGDGIDSYPLVKDYNAPIPPNPGPYSDDHNFNNANDNRTAFNRFKRGGELVERIGWYTSRLLFFNLTWKSPILSGFGDLLSVIFGIKRFLRDAGLQNDYKVKFIIKPNFSDINTYVRNNNGVILVIGNYVSEHKPLPNFSWGHYVAIAGINPNGQIALSDSIRDKTNTSLNPIEHNDASIVSHDIWNVSFDTPAPLMSSWWLPEYLPWGAVIVHGAIIISENE